MRTDKRCKCSMAISFLGEGCRYCQPQEYITKLEQCLDEERVESANDITALRKALLSAQGRLNSPLRMVKCKGFRELMLKIDETLKETEV